MERTPHLVHMDHYPTGLLFLDEDGRYLTSVTTKSGGITWAVWPSLHMADAHLTAIVRNPDVVLNPYDLSADLDPNESLIA